MLMKFVGIVRKLGIWIGLAVAAASAMRASAAEPPSRASSGTPAITSSSVTARSDPSICSSTSAACRSATRGPRSSRSTTATTSRPSATISRLLERHGKQLVIQLQYKAFGKGRRTVPDYLEGPEYGGGVYRASSGSFDPVLWNDNVGGRLDALVALLGREFDRHPAVEALVLPETAPSANLEKSPQPGVDRYTSAIYVEALEGADARRARAFPGTVVIQYANFPQQALPELTEYMKEIGVGMGGPDVYPAAFGALRP